MMRHNLPEDAWMKSSYSGDNGGQCVEKQITADGLVAVGDSKHRDLGAHTFTTAQWQAFVTAVREDALA
ncbi:DUF397 domain-containing protein [Streptomyces sp. NBC_01187]|uniref:DUF397 domain-containing protein n=1 Tax=Streptomyces sp. NBC_01187 TaxID=2903766 RepID=UPI00386F2EC3|nr:DUF397 domain-containing protein [Streptomyces sp. NBC_01187]